MKNYIDCMNEISDDELFDGLLGFGMFAEKLPPIFTSEHFLDYCKNNPSILGQSKPNRYVYFESIRNTNVPRALGIPTPICYGKLCLELKDNWDKIKDVFRNNTLNDNYKVSRIHIRKRQNSEALLKMTYGEEMEDDDNDDSIDADMIPLTTESEIYHESLFSMNYKNWKIDGDPLMDFSLGMKYVVKTDISQCFPSAYSHAISWALVGKEYSKTHRNNSLWFNKIDKACRNTKDGETLGFLIGPHTSNVLSEILLTSIDKELREKGYLFIRNIDDYTCYTESYEKAENFLNDLVTELRKYNFALNHKKTLIEELPQATAEEWIQVLRDKQVIGRYGTIDYNTARSYLDSAILVMNNNSKNASSLLFAIKVLGNPSIGISNSAKKYCIKKMCSLAIIYPYLVPNIDKYVFDAFNASIFEIELFTQKLYEDSVKQRNYEGICYALYFAIKYNFMISIEKESIINSIDCLSKLLLWLYSCKYEFDQMKNDLLNEARRLVTVNEFDENWIFLYEVLPESELQNEWKTMKAAGISFIKNVI